MKYPTQLEISIAESHAQQRFVKKINEPCACRACAYVQAFMVKQIKARLAEQQCGQCGDGCEED